MDHQVKITKWIGKNSPDQTPIMGVALLDASGQAVGLSQLSVPLTVGLGDRLEVRVATDQTLPEPTADEKKTAAKLKADNERMKEDVTRQQVVRAKNFSVHGNIDEATSEQLRKDEETRQKAVVETAGRAKPVEKTQQRNVLDITDTTDTSRESVHGSKSLTSVAATGRPGEVDPDFAASSKDHRQ